MSAPYMSPDFARRLEARGGVLGGPVSRDALTNDVCSPPEALVLQVLEVNNNFHVVAPRRRSWYFKYFPM